MIVFLVCLRCAYIYPLRQQYNDSFLSRSSFLAFSSRKIPFSAANTQSDNIRITYSSCISYVTCNIRASSKNMD